MNAALADSRAGSGLVGSKQGVQALFDSVSLVCGQNPAFTLFQAAQLTYWRIANSER